MAGASPPKNDFSRSPHLESNYNVKLATQLQDFPATKHWRASDGRLLATLPTYPSDPHTNLKIRYGDIAVADAAVDWQVDWHHFEGWRPFASLIGTSDEPEQQFLVVHCVAPHPIAMWEHATGKLVPVADSLDELLALLQ